MVTITQKLAINLFSLYVISGFVLSLNANEIVLELPDQVIITYFDGISLTPFSLSVSNIERIQTATLTLDLNLRVNAFEIGGGFGEFSAAVTNLDDGKISVVMNRNTVPQSFGGTDLIRFTDTVPHHLGIGFGSLEFDSIAIDAMDNEDYQIHAKDGSWFVISDYETSFKVQTVSPDGEPVQNVIVTLQGINGLDTLFGDGWGTGYSPSDANGELMVQYPPYPELLYHNNDLNQPLDINLTFIFNIQPQENSNYKTSRIEKTVQPQRATGIDDIFPLIQIEMEPKPTNVYEWSVY